MIEWLILAAVKALKFVVVTAVTLGTCCLAPGESARHASVEPVPPPPAVVPAVVAETPGAPVQAAEVEGKPKRLAPPVRIETVLTPDLLVPPKARDLRF
jgi:hypothetical protein